MIKTKVKEYNLDTSHWLGQGNQRGKTHIGYNKFKLNEILIENSTYSSTNSLKRRLLKEGLLINKCYEPDCGISNWKEKHLSLHLDHVNGKNDDNRIENLRLLCPNCHSQTDTYAGKNKIKIPINLCSDCGIKIKRSSFKCGRCRLNLPRNIQRNKNAFNKNKFCIDCNIEISLGSQRCKSCTGKFREKPKIQWPSNEDLLLMISQKSYLQIGRELGVSDNAVRKHLKTQRIEVPRKHGARDRS